MAWLGRIGSKEAQEEPCTLLSKVTADESVPFMLNKTAWLADRFESVRSRAQAQVFLLADRAGVGYEKDV